MPVGVEVLVEDGVAAIEFVDATLRGPGLAELFKHARPDEVQKVTRPSTQYLVPVEYARAAGLLDEKAAPAPAETTPSKGYDDGLPDMDWSRPAINDFATKLNPPLDVTGEKNRATAIAAIKAAMADGAKAP